MIFTLPSTMKEKMKDNPSKHNEGQYNHFYPGDEHWLHASANTPQSISDGKWLEFTSYELFLAATP